MTPANFLWYSLIAIADAIVVVFCMAVVVGVVRQSSRSIIQTYFQEYEQMMHRMASARPSMPNELMH